MSILKLPTEVDTGIGEEFRSSKVLVSFWCMFPCRLYETERQRREQARVTLGRNILDGEGKGHLCFLLEFGIPKVFNLVGIRNQHSICFGSEFSFSDAVGFLEVAGP
jgi:hypothetical protein